MKILTERRASTMNLARPSSTGSASELTLLADRISEQQCCMETSSLQGSQGSDVARYFLNSFSPTKKLFLLRCRTIQQIARQEPGYPTPERNPDNSRVTSYPTQKCLAH